ncbi:Late embryogenesis abundant hydroxyproline-rich glycoprotein family [Prunus dulcis]|uniref:Late embryogenesis abundant hydroxyproline-rich glycoprotein family n=1 Tax=Prunus dulcis TaxID=3755 RepID=A0A4Y1QW69_PRUDU|nr:Late embryogenesis abundant hydroxyproline-rich glycoprotein family [Prunus dulcis]
MGAREGNGHGRKLGFYNNGRGPTGSRTQVAGFKVQSANHYTMEPFVVLWPCFEYFVLCFYGHLCASKLRDRSGQIGSSLSLLGLSLSIKSCLVKFQSNDVGVMFGDMKHSLCIVSVDCAIVISPRKQSLTYKQCGFDGLSV